MERVNLARKRNSYLIASRIALSAVVIFLASCTANTTTKDTKPAETQAGQQKNDRLQLSPEAVKAANIETAVAEERETTSSIAVTGAVEANQEKTQQVTPLVSGRVERVNAALGDRVNRGAILAVISSPEVAEMHGKLHQAQTRLKLAQQNLERVQSAENRAGVLQAKARLDQADAELRRMRRLTELGAAAGKDLTAAETGFASAKAEYDYQSNISINREVQAARGEMETAQAETLQLRSSLATLDAALAGNDQAAEPHDASIITLRSPIAGVVTERSVNAGAGIEAGKPIFTVADISTLWVIANVPEGQISALKIGTPAEIRHPELGAEAKAGRVAYIDPNLNEDTRTGRVRVELQNPGGRLKTGMFVEVRFQTAGRKGDDKAVLNVVVPDGAIQRMGERNVVFVPSGNPGEFEIRDVELGEAVGTMHQVKSGLKAGERVVTKGSFVLKTQLMKAQLGEQ